MTDNCNANPSRKRQRRMAREPKSASEVAVSASVSISQADPKPGKAVSKSSLVLTMLERPEGATIVQLADATSWLPHTTRAALTGLKKKGHRVTSDKVKGEERVYRVVAS